MSRILAGVTLVAVLGLMILHLARRETKALSPEDVIFEMVASARAGDVKSYLDCFSGEIKAKLSAQAERDGSVRFASNLCKSTNGLAGVYAAESRQGEDAEIWVEVGFVFPWRTEKQQFWLVKEGREWKIADMESAEYAKPVEKYGSPVYRVFAEEGESKSAR